MKEDNLKVVLRPLQNFSINVNWYSLFMSVSFTASYITNYVGAISMAFFFVCIELIFHSISLQRYENEKCC